MTRFDGGIDAALAAWSERSASAAGVTSVAAIPSGWCTWYAHWQHTTEADVIENLAAADRLDLPIEIVQIDDGYQAAIGDWLETAPTFGPLSELAARIRATGRRAGIWTAPFLVSATSRLAAEHPDWLVGGAFAGAEGNRDFAHVLDVTHPAAAEHLELVYRTLSEHGFDFHKIDFLQAGALAGRRHSDASPLAAYREGLAIIRRAIGPSTVLAAGPLLPSVGLVDAMRIAPDVDTNLGVVPELSRRALRNALSVGRARSWMHGRFWTSDPDCLVVRPTFAQREIWAAHVGTYMGLAFSSDPLTALDDRGIELTRELLRPSSPEPLVWDPFSGPEQGSIRRRSG